MEKNSILIEWDYDSEHFIVIRKLNGVTNSEVIDILNAVKDEFVDGEWSEYVIS